MSEPATVGATTVGAAAAALVRRTRREQGLPATVTDVAVLERVAAIVATSHKGTSATAQEAS